MEKIHAEEFFMEQMRRNLKRVVWILAADGSGSQTLSLYHPDKGYGFSGCKASGVC